MRRAKLETPSVGRAKAARRAHVWLSLVAVAALPVGAVAVLVGSDGGEVVARASATNAAPSASRATPIVSPVAWTAPQARPVGGSSSAVASAPRAELSASSPSDDSSGSLLEALRHASVDEARSIYLSFPRHRGALAEAEQVEGLLARARDANASAAGRAVALEILAYARDVDAAFVERLRAIALASDLDADTRTRAVDLLH